MSQSKGKKEGIPAPGFLADPAPSDWQLWNHRLHIAWDWIASRFEGANWDWASGASSFGSKVCIWIAGLLAAAIVGQLVSDLYKAGSAFEKNVWLQHWHIVYAAPFGLFGLLLHRHEHNIEADRRAVYHVINGMYNDIIQRNTNHDADIRCTVWVPLKHKGPGCPTKLVQWIDYVPHTSPLPDESDKKKRYRRNFGARRKFKVFRSSGGILEPVGLLGRCAVDCLSRRRQEIYLDWVPEEDSFLDYMIRDYNFKPRHARQMTQDRQSFMALPMLSAARTKLLGIVYIDARDRTALSRELGEDLERFLPSIAEALKAD